MIQPIFLTQNDLEKMKKCIIGQGTEGTIYKYNSSTLLKIYHHYYDYTKIDTSPLFDEEGVNIAKPKVTKNIIQNTIQVFDKDGVKLTREEALYKAIEKQQTIFHTYLPNNIVYIDGKIKGCALHYHHRCMNIYRLLNFPLPIRLKVLKEILFKVEELITHNIYHIDLCQHPTIVSKNTNILLSYNLEPQIIDIDGHSAIYTDSFEDKYLKMTEFSLGTLLLEIIFKEYIDDFLKNPDDNDLNMILNNQGSSDIVDDFLSNKLTLSKMRHYLK